MQTVYMPYAGSQNDVDSPGEPASLYLQDRWALVPDFEAVLQAGPVLRDLLPAVARHLAESLGDCCVIRLAAGAGRSSHPVALHHRDPVALALLGEMRATQPRLWADAFNAHVLHTGESVAFTNVPSDLVRLWVHPDFVRYLQRFSLASILVVPLRSRRAIVGTLRMWRDRFAAPYARPDLLFVQEVAEWLAPSLAILSQRAGRRHERIRTLS